MITPWEIYWVLQLDSINNALLAASLICGLSAALVLLISVMARILDEMGDQAWLEVLKWSKRLFIATGALIVAVAVIPSTKTAAAMIVVPKIVNSPTIQHEAGDLYKLAKEALSNAIAPAPKDK